MPIETLNVKCEIKENEELDIVHHCNICNTRFKTQHTLHTHMLRKHKNTKTFVCKVCGRSFDLERALISHMIISTNCSKAQKIHSEPQDHTCAVCNKRLKNSEFLKLHMLHHEGSFSCSICGKKFDVQYKLQNHLRRRPNCAKPRKNSIFKPGVHPDLNDDQPPEKRTYCKNFGAMRQRIVETAENGEDFLALATSLGIKYKTAYYWVRYARLQRYKMMIAN